jgi:phosphate transport system permease protein
MNNHQRHILQDRLFRYFGIACTFSGLILLAIFILDILFDGLGRINLSFFTNLPSRKPDDAGIYTAIIGTLMIMIHTAVIAIPLGVAAGVYLEEYGGRKSRFARFLEVNINNLAGVPSIIYGLLGLEVFVHGLNLGQSVLSASLTLALLILPIIIVTTREAIRAVPSTLRQASYGMGATRWQTIWHLILPASSGGILTGIILALSRVIGESAPLIAIGVMVYVPFAPTSPLDEFSALPVQIFNWISRPQKGFMINAAAAIIVLLVISLAMNLIAVYFRNKWQKQFKP